MSTEILELEAEIEDLPTVEDVTDEDTAEDTEETAEENADADDIDDGAESDEDQPEPVEIELDGKTYLVHPDLQESFLKNADYTQKTQQIAEHRKALDAAFQGQALAEQAHQEQMAIQGALADEYGQLSAIEAQLASYERVNWPQIRENDPDRYQLHRDHQSDLREQRNQLGQAIQQKAGEVQLARQQQQAEMAQHCNAVLAQTIPGWGVEAYGECIDYGRNSGFGDQELSSVVDPRMIAVLHKAAQADKLQKEVSDLKALVEGRKKRATKTTKTVKPLTKTPKGQSSVNNGLSDSDDMKTWLKKREKQVDRRR